MSNFRYNITKNYTECNELFISNLLDPSDCICDSCLNILLDKQDEQEDNMLIIKQELFLELNF